MHTTPVTPAAFEDLVAESLPRLRAVIRRMVGHPDDTDDLQQDALARAFAARESFRGDAQFSTWLCAIGARVAVDHLRRKKRWRERAQVIFAAAALESAEIQGAVGGALGSPEFRFDAREHIAYCFTCVGRTLEPDLQAALVLRDVAGLSNREAADALEVTHSVLRHRLTEARAQMQSSFDDLCALVSKKGVCYQCAGLRQVAPEGREGDEPPQLPTWDARLEVVRAADPDGGSCRPLHDLFHRFTERQEQERLGDEAAMTDCGRPPDA